MLEETGLEIELTELLGFYMDVYDAEADIHTLNIVYLARVVGGEEKAGSDAARLRWFPVTALPEKIAFNFRARRPA